MKRNAAISPEQVSKIETEVLAFVEKRLMEEFESRFFPLSVELLKEMGHWHLRISVENTVMPTSGERISIQDCEDVSRFLNPEFDTLSCLGDLSYHFEVSSPGLNREIKTSREFLFYRGLPVLVTVKTKNGNEESDSEIVHEGCLGDFNASGKTLSLLPLSATDANATQQVIDLTHSHWAVQGAAEESTQEVTVILNPPSSLSAEGEMDDDLLEESSETDN